MSISREELLESYGRFYGAEHFAVTFTAGISGDSAKRVISKGWDKTAVLASPDYAAGLITNRGRTHNIAIVLRPSNLIVLECDSEPDLAIIQSLGLPETVTVKSSAAYKRHFYFRPPPSLETLPFVAFRFESEKLTADSGRYFLAPPSIHPSGETYSFLAGHGPDDLPIAELPDDVYKQLCQTAREQTTEQRDQIEIDPDAKIRAGNRRDLIFRYACMLRRWGVPQQEISLACHNFNKTRCDPPVEDSLVEVQVNGAMQKQGDQELVVAQDVAPETRIVVYTAVQIAALPDPPDSDILLGPYVTRSGRTLVVGATGHGKTTLSFQMVAAIVQGDDFLGHQGIGNATALIIDLEQGLRSIKRGIREAGLHEEQRVHIAAVPDGLALDNDEQDLAELHEVIANTKPDVLLLDPYYKAHRAEDPNAERPIVDLMRILDALRAKFGFALILPAHPRKNAVGDGVRKLTIDDISGSGAVSRGAEIGLGIERLAHGYARLRYLKDREGELPIGDAAPLIYNKSTGFQLDPKEAQSKDELEAEISRLVSEGAFHTSREWASRLGIRNTKARDMLENMAVTGAIQVVVGPPGRSARSRCYGIDPALFNPESSTAPNGREQSGTAEQSQGTDSTVPTVPTLIENVEQGTVRGPAKKREQSAGTEQSYDDDIPF